MTRSTILMLIGMVGATLIAAAAMMARDYTREQMRFAQRMALIRPAAPGAPAQRTESWLPQLGAALANTSVFGTTEVAKLKQNLYAAGFHGDAAVERFIGLKVAIAGLLLLLGIVGPGLLGFAPSTLTAVLFMLGGLVAGMRGPDVVLAQRASGRREAMDRGLPDALDLLVVCAEAGIGLEIALERVARELTQVHPVLARELAVTVAEMRILPDRIQALHNMGERVRLESVRSIASTLSQTLRYGTPLGKALRTLAQDVRLVRQTKMETAAARLPVLITVPMIAFILPSTALVVAGPAFLQLIRSLGSISSGAAS